MTKEHWLKCHPRYFAAIVRGVKPWEVRDCTDRDFRVGDELVLWEWDPAPGEFTGRVIFATVGFLVGGADGVCPDSIVVFTLVDLSHAEIPPAEVAEMWRLRRAELFPKCVPGFDQQ